MDTANSLYDLVGWTTQAQQLAAQQSYTQPYDPYSGVGGPQQDVGVKVKLVNLIGAVRTLMRGAYPKRLRKEAYIN